MSGSIHTAITPGLAIPAPVTGVAMGRGRSGPLSLRLFRPNGTRVVVVSAAFSAQLLTLRAAASGAAVRVLTGRPAAWSPILRYGADSRLVPPTSAVPPQSGPMLIVDDRADEPRSIGKVNDWQCLLDIHTVRLDLPREWMASYASTFAHADLAVFGMVSPELADAAAAAFDLGDAAGTLTVVPPHSVALVTRGKVELVRTDATAAETQAMRPAG